MKWITERKLDELGRIVLPMEVRSANGWMDKASLAIWLEEDGSVVLRSPENRCCVCGSGQSLQPIRRKWLCADCVGSLKFSKESVDN